jgi:DNA mismatch repair ATPase MutS
LSHLAIINELLLYFFVGLSIAIAISEKLLELQSIVLFVTHYQQITLMPSLYADMKNYHLKTSIQFIANTHSAPHQENGRDDAKIKISYLHQLDSGPCDLQNGYGILMSELYDFPLSLIQDAKQLRHLILQKYSFPLQIQENNTDVGDGNNAEKFALIKKLKNCLAEIDRLEREESSSEIVSEIHEENQTLEVAAVAVRKKKDGLRSDIISILADQEWIFPFLK